MLFGSFFAQGQSLKEALFSGKLKNEPGTTIRKGEDLSTKIDTATRKVAVTTDSVKTSPATAGKADNAAKLTPVQGATTTTTTVTQTTVTPATSNETAEQTGTAPAAAEAAATHVATPAAAKPKDNTALFKEHMQTLKSTLESDVLSSKKLKKGSYYVQVTYVIGTDGQTTITDVYVDPENKFLQQQIADRLNSETPKLNPVLNSTGTARKVTKRYNFTLEKQ